MTPRLVAFALVAAIAAVGNVLAGPSTPAGYVIYQTVALDPVQSGMSGALQILQDRRVTAAYRETWGTSSDPEVGLGEDDPFVKAIAKEPLKNGRLRLVDQQGHVLVEEEFGAPLAKLETKFLYGSKFPTYLVTVDYGVGFGSYAGPGTELAEVRQGKLQFLHPVEKTDNKDNRIALGRSLKNGWEIVRSATGTGKDILQVQCHPNFDNPKWADAEEFVVVYTRYSFDGHDWHQASRKRIGFWESEDFPAPSYFP